VSEVYLISEMLISFTGYSAKRINTDVSLLIGLYIFVYAPFSYWETSDIHAPFP